MLPTLLHLLNVFVLCRFFFKALTVDLLITKECCLLILMHSNITKVKCRKRTFGVEFEIPSVALPVNLANVKAMLKNVSYRKTPISQNVQGMGDSRLFQRKPFSHQLLTLEILPKSMSWVSCLKKHSLF